MIVFWSVESIGNIDRYAHIMDTKKQKAEVSPASLRGFCLVKRSMLQLLCLSYGYASAFWAWLRLSLPALALLEGIEKEISDSLISC